MKFLVDAHLPRQLATLLNGAGQDATHTRNLPLRNLTPDKEICDTADREGRVVITKDVDFVASFYLSGRPKKLLIVSTGNISNAALLALFATHLSNLTMAIQIHSYVELSRTAIIIHS